MQCLIFPTSSGCRVRTLLLAPLLLFSSLFFSSFPSFPLIPPFVAGDAPPTIPPAGICDGSWCCHCMVFLHADSQGAILVPIKKKKKKTPARTVLKQPNSNAIFFEWAVFYLFA